MSLCVTPLPPDCQKELKRILQRISDADLDVAIRTEPAFRTGGFRPGAKRSVLLPRLEQIVCGGAVISDSLRQTIAKRSRACTLTGRLEESTLVDLRHAFATLLGTPVFLVSCLLDGRRGVRENAEQWLQNPLTSFSPCDAKQAVDQLRSVFGELQELMGVTSAPAEGGDAPMTVEKWQEQRERLELKIKELQNENRRLRGVETQAEQTRKKLGDTEIELAKQKEIAALRETELKSKREEAESYRVELHREIVHREQRVLADVDRRMAQEFFGWLSAAREVEQTVRDESVCDLLARTDAALAKQAEIDRNAGNRVTLRKRLEEVTAKLKEVEDTLANAIRQSPALKEIEGELRKEEERLATILYPGEHAPLLEERIIDRIHAAKESGIEWESLRRLSDSLESFQLVGKESLERIRREYEKRKAAFHAIGVPETAPRRKTTLEKALCGEIPAILMLDGHNVLLTLAVRYNPKRGQSMSNTQRRGLLIRDVEQLISMTPTLRSWIVFDGADAAESTVGDNLRVLYSGGLGEHRADRVLVDTIRFFRTDEPELVVLLVSDDKDLCAQVQKLGAETIGVVEFGDYLPSTL